MHLSKSGVSIYLFPIFLFLLLVFWIYNSVCCTFILNLFACVLILLIKQVTSLLSQYMINVHYISRHMGTWKLLIKLCFLEYMLFDHGEMRIGVSKNWQHFKYLSHIFIVLKKNLFTLVLVLHFACATTDADISTLNTTNVSLIDLYSIYGHSCTCLFGSSYCFIYSISQH